ncbi:MAG: hypothetical protein Q9169_003771 [Polycauliona sp. 2 TL-2023]
MTEYEKLTVVKLREELVKRGLPKTGVKAVLVQRLNEADETSVDADTATSDAPSEGHDARKSTATSSAVPGEQHSGSPGITGNGVDTTHSVVRAVEIPQSDGPSDVRADVDQETPPEGPKPKATSEEERPPPETDSSHTTRVDPAETQLNGKQSTMIAPLAHPDGEVIMAEKQEATPTTQLPTTTTDSQVASAEEQTPAVSTSESATGEEMMKDIRKRKRRSLTPTPSDESIQKKAKTDGEASVKLPEDESMDESNTPPVPNVPTGEPIEAGEPNSTEDTAMENAPALSEPEIDGHADRPIDSAHAAPVAHDTETDARTPPEAPENRARSSTPDIQNVPAVPESPVKTSSPDARFKNLLPTVSRRESSPIRHAPEEKTDERVVSPALHPATTALYIRDIVRPLHVDSLKEHLITLATPSNASPDPGVITECFLDSIRTHCLVRFGSVAAASRVRTGLHARVWPDEKNRKALWVDFVPEEKLPQWIEVENASSGRGQTAKRYEVVYENEEDGVKAYLQLVGSNTNGGLGKAQAADSQKEGGVGVRGAPLGPRLGGGEANGPQQPKIHSDQGRGFQALDDLFQSTSAKPKIYYLPVPKRTAEKRMDMLAEGRGGGRREGIHRYTFDEGVLVDRGPEMPRGRGGFDRGRGGGSYRGYSDRGGGYRGDHRRDYRGDYGGGGGDYRTDYRRERR